MTTSNQTNFWRVVISLIAFTLLLLGGRGANSTTRADDAPWPLSHSFRVSVVVEEQASAFINRPVGVRVDFGKLLRDSGEERRLHPNSIRVVRLGSAVASEKEDGGSRKHIVVPHAVTGDLVNDERGTVWWRLKDSSDRRFHVYFDTVDRGRPKRVGLIGVGDTFHYNSGQTAMANAVPLHSQFASIDWDGDGRRDLLGFGFRVWEHGETLSNDLGNAVFFLKNIGENSRPVFAPRYRVKGADGRYLSTELLPQNMIPADWDDDGDVDFHGIGPRQQLLLWKNTGRRDDRGLWLLNEPQVVMKLDTLSPFRRNTPGILRKTGAWYPRGVRRIDWEADGDFDLLVAYRKVSRLRVVDASRGVMPYGTAMMVFDLFENKGPDEDGKPNYAPPRTLHEHTGFPIRARGHANGAAEYVDWDRDGDFDLLFHDETARPLEGGRMMFAENRGSRAAPMFEPPIPILPINDSPFAVDWNEDGRTDVIAGGEFFENVNPHRRKNVQPRTVAGTRIPRGKNFPRLKSRGFAQQIEPEILSYFTVSVDWENDGDLDLLGGYQTGLRLFVNRGTTLEPVFDRPVMIEAGGKPVFMPNWLDPQADPPSSYGPQGPTEAIYGWLCPTVGDWDGDGDLDLLATGQRWQTQYFENTGTRERPRLATGREVRCEGAIDEFSWRSKPSMGDLDGDGRTELVVTSDRDNAFYLYEQDAQQSDLSALDFSRGEALMLENGAPVKGWYGGQNNNGDNHSLLIDWDGDGDLDLLNGTLWAVWYYENVGDSKRPLFRAHGKFKIGDAHLQSFRHAGSFDAADWNQDGRLDLVLGTECPSDQPQGAVLHLFERTYLENRLPKAAVGKLEEKRRD